MGRQLQGAEGTVTKQELVQALGLVSSEQHENVLDSTEYSDGEKRRDFSSDINTGSEAVQVAGPDLHAPPELRMSNLTLDFLGDRSANSFGEDSACDVTNSVFSAIHRRDVSSTVGALPVKVTGLQELTSRLAQRLSAEKVGSTEKFAFNRTTVATAHLFSDDQPDNLDVDDQEMDIDLSTEFENVHKEDVDETDEGENPQQCETPEKEGEGDTTEIDTEDQSTNRNQGDLPCEDQGVTVQNGTAERVNGKKNSVDHRSFTDENAFHSNVIPKETLARSCVSPVERETLRDDNIGEPERGLPVDLPCEAVSPATGHDEEKLSDARSDLEQSTKEDGQSKDDKESSEEPVVEGQFDDLSDESQVEDVNTWTDGTRDNLSWRHSVAPATPTNKEIRISGAFGSPDSRRGTPGRQTGAEAHPTVLREIVPMSGTSAAESSSSDCGSSYKREPPLLETADKVTQKTQPESSQKQASGNRTIGEVQFPLEGMPEKIVSIPVQVEILSSPENEKETEETTDVVETNKEDDMDIVLIEDDEEEQDHEDVHPNTEQMTHGHPSDIQMTFEKAAPQRKRNYPFGAEATTSRGEAPDRFLNTHPDRDQSPKEMVSCGVCSQRYLDIEGVQYHLKIAHTYEVFCSCLLCGQVFGNKNSFKYHRELKHPDERYFRCPHCSCWFGKDEVQYHREECRPPTPPTTTNNRVGRSQSSQNMQHTVNQSGSRNRGRGRAPRGVGHPNSNARRPAYSSYSSSSQARTQRRPQQAQGYSMAAPRVPLAPPRIPVTSPPHLSPQGPQSQSVPARRRLDRSMCGCDQCNAFFPNQRDYERHVMEVHQRYPCPVCDQTFTTNQKKDRHMLIHNVM